MESQVQLTQLRRTARQIQKNKNAKKYNLGECNRNLPIRNSYNNIIIGSLATVWCCEQTAVPELRWITVHPSNFEKLLHQHIKPLSLQDDCKLKFYLNMHI